MYPILFEKPGGPAYKRLSYFRAKMLANCVGWWRCKASDFNGNVLTNEIPGSTNFALTSPSWTVKNGKRCLLFTGQNNASSYGTLTINAGDLLDPSGATSLTRLCIVLSLGSGGNGNGRVISGFASDFIVRAADVFNALSVAVGSGFTNFGYSGISYATGFQIIAEVYDGSKGTRTLFVNGIQVGNPVTGVSSALNTGLNTTLRLAAQNSGGQPSQFNGYISEVAFFINRAMSGQEQLDFVLKRPNSLLA